MRDQHVDIGAFISAVIYFVIFMAVIYFVIVVPYRAVQKRRGVTVFGEPAARADMSGLPFGGPADGRDKVQVLRNVAGGAGV